MFEVWRVQISMKKWINQGLEVLEIGSLISRNSYMFTLELFNKFI